MGPRCMGVAGGLSQCNDTRGQTEAPVQHSMGWSPGVGDPRTQSRAEESAKVLTAGEGGPLETERGTPGSRVHAGNQQSVVSQTPIGKSEKHPWKHDSRPPPHSPPFPRSVIFLQELI